MQQAFEEKKQLPAPAPLALEQGRGSGRRAHGDQPRRECWDYQRGECRRGARCRFSHTVCEEKQGYAPPAQASQREDRKGGGDDTPPSRNPGPPGVPGGTAKRLWNFSVSEQDRGYLKAAGIACLDDVSQLPSILPVQLMIFITRVCRAHKLWWDLNPFNLDRADADAGVLSCDPNNGDPEVTHIFGCVEAKDVFTLDGLKGFPMLDSVLVRAGQREVVVPIVSGTVWATYGPFAVVGPSDGAPTHGFDRPSYVPLIKAGDEGRTLWQSGSNTTWSFPSMEIMTWGDRVLARAAGGEHIYVVPNSYIARARHFFVTKPVRTPDNFRACVMAVSAHAQTAVSTDQPLQQEALLVLAAVVIAYRDVEETTSLLVAAFAPGYESFNALVLGERVWFIQWWALLGSLLAATLAGVIGVWLYGPSWSLYTTAGVFGLVWLLVLVWHLQFHRGRSTFGGPDAPSVRTLVRRTLVFPPGHPGGHYPVGARVFSCRSAGELCLPPPSTPDVPNQLDPRVVVTRDVDLITSCRTSVHLTRVGVSSLTIPTVHCPQPRTVFAALARFLNDYSPPAEPPELFEMHTRRLRRNWSEEYRIGVQRLRFKPDIATVMLWWEEYRKHPNKSRLKYVWDTLFSERDGVIPYLNYEVDDPHVMETEFFGKLEVASRMRGIESVHPYLLVVLGVADYLLRPMLYRMYRHLSVDPGRSWTDKLFWAPGCDRGLLAQWGWTFRFFCIISWDFSRWDGSVPKWAMELIYALYRSDDPLFNALLARLTRRSLRMRFNRKRILAIDFSGKVMSGSPWTTLLNTMLHWAVMSYAFRVLGWLDHLQSMILGGDDGTAALSFEFGATHAALLKGLLLEAFGFKMDPLIYGPITHADFFSSRWVPVIADGEESFAFVPKCGRALQKVGWAIDVNPGQELSIYKAKLLSLYHNSRGCPLCDGLVATWLENARFQGVQAAPLPKEEHQPTPDRRVVVPCGVDTWNAWYPGESILLYQQCDDPFGTYNFDRLCVVDYGKENFMGKDAPNEHSGTHFPVTVDPYRADRPQTAVARVYEDRAAALSYPPCVSVYRPQFVRVVLDGVRRGARRVRVGGAGWLRAAWLWLAARVGRRA